MKGVHLFFFIIYFFISCSQRDRSNYLSTLHLNDSSVTIEKENVLKSQVIPRNKKKIEGRTVRIKDGDTFVLLLNNDFEIDVRLNGIDCPEKKQAFSQRAKEELSNLIFDKEVIVFYDKKDGFGRILGNVLVDGTNVNHEMIKSGMAWHYVKYSSDQVLANLEKDARRKKIGLWSDPNPVPPWKFRK